MSSPVLQMECVDSANHNESYRQLVQMMNDEIQETTFITNEHQNRKAFRRKCCGTSCLDKMVRYIAKNYLTKESDRQYYSDRYTCCPPPWFVPVITMAEVGLFTYHCMDAGSITANGPIPAGSILIYRPDKRIQIWRFLLYTFIHAGWVHLFFNMVVQILLGVPLEMVHGTGRIIIVYVSGVIAGSLGTSVFDKVAYLVGASGGVYALLAAHLANIILNYTEMEFGFIKLGAVFVIGELCFVIFGFITHTSTSADVGFAIWNRLDTKELSPGISYTAHLTGAVAGLTVGLIVLKNFEQKLHEQYIWWIALGIYTGCAVFAVCWNIFYY